MSDEMSGNRRIGYGSPPKEHQFKPGQSGNPKGRPRRKRPKLSSQSDLNRLYINEAMKLIQITENGKSQKVSVLEAIVRRSYQLALKGDQRSINLFFSRIAEALLDTNAQTTTTPPILSRDPVKAAEEYRKLMLRTG